MPFVANGAFELDLNGPRSAAIGGAGAGLGGDPWSSLRNPALAVTSRRGLGTCWSQQFGLPELARETIGFNGHFRQISYTVVGANFGSEFYREDEFGLIAAHRLRNDLAIGLELCNKWLNIQDYPVGSAFSVAAGVLINPTETISIGAAWSNLNEPRISNYRDRISSSLRIGLAAAITENTCVAADIIQEKHFKAEYRFGAEASFLPGFQLRIGARAEPIRPSAGFQLDIGRWSFLYGGDLHPDLGASHEVGLEFRVGR